MSEKVENLFLQSELDEISETWKTIPDSELICCIPTITQIKIKKTPAKTLTVCLLFPEGYPDEPLLIQLKSKTLEHQFLDGLTKLTEEKLRDYIGGKQILAITKHVGSLLDENQLCVCAGEIRKIKRELLCDMDECKLKQKQSQVHLTAKANNYFYSVRMDVPNLYPDELLKIHVIDQNFPEVLNNYFIKQANEIARKCVQPPKKPKPKDPPFQVQSALYPVVEFLVKDCVRRYADSNCPICKRKALPDDPMVVKNDKNDPEYLERVYCGDVFHFGCLDNYFKQPPFKDGKPCPACKAKIYHDRWRVSDTVREARWAAKQAKQRELEEVADFLS